MATFTARKKPKPIKIDKFFGANEAVGETEVNPGEWISGFNARVTKNYKMQKRPGHHTFIDFGSGNVQGLWYGTLDGDVIMLVCWDGDVYRYDMSIDTDTTAVADLITEGTVTIIGSISDTKTCITYFQDKIYFLNGADYKEYDGSVYQDVVAYIPTVVIASPPAGGGTLFEEINLLTGQKSQTYVGDGSSTLYQLAETSIDVDTVLCSINGVSKTEGVDFTVNRTLGQVTFTVAPILNAIVIITWVKEVAGNDNLVKNHKYMVDFGVQNDTNLFIWGNPNERNVFRFSGIAKANYFPANSFVGVGSTEFFITDLKASQQNLMVFKEKATFIVNPTVNPNFSDNAGLNPFNYGYQDLNERVGNLAPKMVQLVEDTPISLDGFSFWQWGITNVELQRNTRVISDRLKLSLKVLNLRNAVTFNYENQKEYWCNVDSTVYIWNYGNDTMYKYSDIQATQFIDADGVPYYGSNGTVEKISEDFLADGTVLGDTIPMKIYGGFLDFDALEYRKMMRDQWLSIRPDSRTSVQIKFITDRINEESAKWYPVEYKLIDFDNIDFDDWTFLTNRSAQVNRIRGKVKKFTYVQWVMENDTNNETLTVLKLLMQAQTNGYSR